MRFALLLVTLLLSGCVTATPTNLADGSKGHLISCSGGGLYGTYIASWGQCYQKAGELCGSKGFNIVERVGENGALVADGVATTTNNRMMIVQCRV